jgi:hypothetical protein
MGSMIETRLRGTDKGDVVTEALVDGVWTVVDRHALDVEMLKIGEAVMVDVNQTPDIETDKPRRGRPPKAVA